MAESAKFVSWMYCVATGMAAGGLRITMAALTATREQRDRRRPRERTPLAPLRRHRRGAALSHEPPQIGNDLPHGLHALGRIFLQRALNQLAQRQRNRLRQPIGGSMRDRVQDVEVGGPSERAAPGEQLVQHDGKREHVASRVDRLAGCLLGRHVRDGADDDARPGARLGRRVGDERGRLAQLRQAEVRQLRVAGLRDQDVLGLDVTMQNAGLVRRGKTICEADDELDDVLPRPWTRLDPVSERAAVNELADKVLAPVQLAGVIDREDVGMIERGCELRFALEAPPG